MKARWKSWQAMEAAMENAADAQAEGAFVHPGEAIDAKGKPQAATAGHASRFTDVFIRFNASCLPARSFGTGRRWLAGYHRYVALCYRVTPEMFEGMSRAEIAKRVGISLRAFGKQLQYIDELMAGREPPAGPAGKR